MGETGAPQPSARTAGLAAYDNVHDGSSEEQNGQNNRKIEEQFLNAAPRSKYTALTATADTAQTSPFALQHNRGNQRNRNHNLNKIYVKSQSPYPPLATPSITPHAPPNLHSPIKFSNGNLTADFERAGILAEQMRQNIVALNKMEPAGE